MDTFPFSFASKTLDDRFAAAPGEAVFVAAKDQEALEHYLGFLEESNPTGAFLIPASPPVGELARPGEIDATTAEIYSARVRLARWNAASEDAILLVLCPHLHTAAELAGWVPDDATAVFVTSGTSRVAPLPLACEAWRGYRGFPGRVVATVEPSYASELRAVIAMQALLRSRNLVDELDDLLLADSFASSQEEIRGLLDERLNYAASTAPGAFSSWADVSADEAYTVDVPWCGEPILDECSFMVPFGALLFSGDIEDPTWVEGAATGQFDDLQRVCGIRVDGLG